MKRASHLLFSFLILNPFNTNANLNPFSIPSFKTGIIDTKPDPSQVNTRGGGHSNLLHLDKRRKQIPLSSTSSSSTHRPILFCGKKILRQDIVVVEEGESDAIIAEKKKSAWPPWPFNLIKKDEVTYEKLSGSVNMLEDVSGAKLFLRYFRERAKIGVRQLQKVASDTTFHLPPAFPPILVLAIAPITPHSNPYARRMALTSLGLAILSWAHYQTHKTKHLTPLPLHVKRKVLPPFLPEDIPSSILDTPSPNEQQQPQLIEDENSSSTEQQNKTKLSKIKHRIKYIASTPTTLQSTVEQWKILRQERRRALEKMKRNAIMEKLIALQSIKKKLPISSQKNNGYALVTGASRGLGRAIAVQLARYDIPLILVARDTDKLQRLANDLQLCYGIECYVIPADLSNPDAPLKVFNVTQSNNLNVDILVNNAGLCYRGNFVDHRPAQVERIVQVNALSTALLGNLYGRVMKKNKRGRILFVSSIVGSVPAGPGVAAYAATKAFEKSMALSMAKELEPYGVGVTCLMPGAIRGTDFRMRSDVDDALCWKLPFYPRSAEHVAKRGVMAILQGDTEVLVGWQNQVLVRVLQQVIPQRFTTMIVETAWKPLEMPWRKRNEEVVVPPKYLEDDGDGNTGGKKKSMIKLPPRVLILDDEEEESVEVENTEVETKNESDNSIQTKDEEKQIDVDRKETIGE